MSLSQFSPQWDGANGMELIAALSDLCKQTSRPVIAIDGPAGAGKTTLAHEIFLALSNSMSIQVIHMDDLYAGWDNALTADLTKLLSYLVEKHRANSPANIQRYNWSTSSFGESEVLPVADLLILEGVGSGDKEIQDNFAALIWMDIDPADGLKRVINRDGEQVAEQMKKWLTTQEKYFLQHSTREKADFILTT
jgi:uridine kinase